MQTNKTGETIVLTDEQKKKRRHRSIAIACGLVAFCILVYTLTLIKMGPQIIDRPL